MIHVAFNDNPEDHPDYWGWVIAYKDANGEIYDVAGAFDSEATAARLAGLTDDHLDPIDNTGCS